MQLKQLLELQRAHYIMHFQRSARRFPDGFPEVLFELNFPAPDEVFRLYRADMVRLVGNDQKIIDIALTEPMAHAVWEGAVGDATVVVQPFEWNACIVEALTDRFDRAAVLAWATHWIDIEDTREPDGDGLRDVIHNISPPSYPLGKLTMKIDFGTAPTQAVIELIKVLTMGAKEAQITLSSAAAYERG